MKTKTLIGGVAVIATTAVAMLAIPAIAQSQGPGMMGGPGERPTFEQLDADGDGNVTVAEVKAHAASEFAERDTNGDGILSVEEMTAHVAARAVGRAGLGISRMMDWRDLDGDGGLSQAELGGMNGQRMFLHLDADEDGLISAEEFAEMEGQAGFGRKGRGAFGNHERGGRGFGDHQPGGRGFGPRSQDG